MTAAICAGHHCAHNPVAMATSMKLMCLGVTPGIPDREAHLEFWLIWPIIRIGGSSFCWLLTLDTLQPHEGRMEHWAWMNTSQELAQYSDSSMSRHSGQHLVTRKRGRRDCTGTHTLLRVLYQAAS